MKIVLRTADFNDCDMLFSNRNDELTRKNSLDTAPIDFKSHQEWLVRCLHDPQRALFIFEVENEAVGTSRLDRFPEYTQMSWSVFPAYRKRGYGVLLVRETLKHAKGLVRAEVKSENTASKKIAEKAGFVLQEEKNGLCQYEILTPNQA